MNPKFQSLYGLKFNPFRPEVPVEALYATPDSLRAREAKVIYSLTVHD